jgi:hypothetical protein
MDNQGGATSVEYLVACAVLILLLGIAMADDGSILRQLLLALRAAFQNYSYAISLPE